MARYDVYESGDDILLLDVQADLLDEIKTRLVAPLILYEKASKPSRRLNPVFNIGEERYVMVTQLITAIPATELKASIANLNKEHDTIATALDMIFYGF